MNLRLKSKQFTVTLVAVALILSFSLGIVTAPYMYSVMVGTQPKVYANVEVAYRRAGETEWTILMVHNLLTNGGKEFVEDKLANAANASKVLYISVSTSASSPDATWTNIPSEITTGGLERATGAYTSTGTGAWTVEYTFTATATHTNVQLSGISWASTSNGGGLFATATFTAVTLQSADQLKVSWSLSCS